MDGFSGSILEEVYWSFSGGPIGSREDFNLAIREYLDDLKLDIDQRWNPEEVVLHHPRVLISYYDASPAGEAAFELSADDGRAFTASELLFKIHNAVVGPLQGDDHHFFEGLEFAGLSPENVPIYSVNLGS